jgi:hypothetical protein
VTLNRCMIAVIGLDLKCPRCGITVHSGTRHECSDGIATSEPFSVDMPALPKPKQVRRKPDAVKVYPDGREVCAATPAGVKEYRDRTRKMWARQGHVCGLQISELCVGKKWLSPGGATFDHEDGRGMGAARRDDRIEKDGKPYNCAACGYCNAEKGSRRLEKMA